jgi:uncharacterized membrane protein
MSVIYVVKKKRALNEKLLVGALLCVVGLAGVSFAAYYIIDYFSTEVVLSDSGSLSTSMPAHLDAVAGSVYNYTYNVTNRANQDLKYELALTLSPYNTSVRLLLDGNMTETLPSVNRILSIGDGESVNGTIRVQFGQNSSMGTYSLNLTLMPYQFNYTI